jgi:signal transduction histidine kinase
MPHFQSILSRIVILHVIAVVITSVAMSLALSWLLNRATNNLHNEAMRKQATMVAGYLKLGSDGQISVDLPADLQGFYSQPYGRYVYAVLDDKGRVLLSSQADHSEIFPKRDDSAVTFEQTRHGDAIISGASLRKTVAGRDLWVQTGEDLANRDVLIDDITAGFFRDAGWITLPILLLLLVIDIAIFRRALLPLRQASTIAQQIGPSRTDLRLPISDIPREIRPLMMAVNLALDRLDEGFRVQREFTADAAHELRTPLSVLRTRIDIIADRSVAKQLYGDIEGMSRVVSQLLEIAEVETAVLGPDEKADLREISAEVAGFVAPIALAQGKSVALVGFDGPVVVNGNAEMLTRAIRNLADNAIAHTPPDTVVEFGVEQSGVIRVRDFGPGISDVERDLIFQRFWRRDRSWPGTGLGLSIVRRIVEIHGAHLEVANATNGGAIFSIEFRRNRSVCVES